MHRVDSLTYVGAPNEAVTLSTRVNGGGQITVTLDGQPIQPNSTFPLPAAPGGHRALQIGLFGPIGASCAVGIATVDGGTDGDFLVCQPHTPAPTHNYSFTVAAQAAINAFRQLKSGATAKKRGGQ